MKRIILVILAAFLASCSSTPTPMPDLTASLPVESPTPPVTGERIIQFSGYDWVVRDGGLSGPGPNTWSGSNVWVDENGDLHLKISRTESGWTCAEVTTTERLGFGIYQFQVIGPIDQLDANVVFGMFNYPTEDVGSNATNEIDIEYAHWGNPEWPIGNFTVWPAQSGMEQISESFPVTLNGTYTTHRFVWESQKILFQALHGHRDDDENEIANWLYKPDESLVHISQQAMPVHINLWLFQGQPPVDGNEVEVVIHSFTFASLGK